MEKSTVVKIRVAVLVVAAAAVFAVLAVIGAGCHWPGRSVEPAIYESAPKTVGEATVRTIEKTVYRRNTLEMAAIAVGAFGVVLCFAGSPLAGGGLITACIFTVSMSSAMTMYPRIMAAAGVILVLGAGGWAIFLIMTKTKLPDGLRQAFGQVVATVEEIKKELPIEKAEALFADDGPIKTVIQSAATGKLVKQVKEKLKPKNKIPRISPPTSCPHVPDMPEIPPPPEPEKSSDTVKK
jgi:hypothetical protein